MLQYNATEDKYVTVQYIYTVHTNFCIKIILFGLQNKQE